MNIEETKRKLVEEFRESCGDFWDGDDGLYEAFIGWLSAAFSALEKAVEKEVLKSLPPERIIHAYMESQNTGENRGWNDYRNAAIKSILAKTQ